MKYKFNRTSKYLAAMVMVLIMTQSCNKDWLTPKPLSFFSPENTLIDERGFNAGLAAIARQVRDEFYGDGHAIITENIFSEVAVEGTMLITGWSINLAMFLLLSKS